MLQFSFVQNIFPTTMENGAWWEFIFFVHFHQQNIKYIKKWEIPRDTNGCTYISLKALLLLSKAMLFKEFFSAFYTIFAPLLYLIHKIFYIMLYVFLFYVAMRIVWKLVRFSFFLMFWIAWLEQCWRILKYYHFQIVSNCKWYKEYL